MLYVSECQKVVRNKCLRCTEKTFWTITFSNKQLVEQTGQESMDVTITRSGLSLSSRVLWRQDGDILKPLGYFQEKNCKWRWPKHLCRRTEETELKEMMLTSCCKKDFFSLCTSRHGEDKPASKMHIFRCMYILLIPWSLIHETYWLSVHNVLYYKSPLLILDLWI